MRAHCCAVALSSAVQRGAWGIAVSIRPCCCPLKLRAPAARRAAALHALAFEFDEAAAEWGRWFAEVAAAAGEGSSPAYGSSEALLLTNWRAPRIRPPHASALARAVPPTLCPHVRHLCAGSASARSARALHRCSKRSVGPSQQDAAAARRTLRLRLEPKLSMRRRARQVAGCPSRILLPAHTHVAAARPAACACSHPQLHRRD